MLSLLACDADMKHSCDRRYTAGARRAEQALGEEHEDRSGAVLPPGTAPGYPSF
jgi:hypothetical protein